MAINASMNSICKYVNIGVIAKYEGLGEEDIIEVKYDVVIRQHIANLLLPDEPCDYHQFVTVSIVTADSRLINATTSSTSTRLCW